MKCKHCQVKVIKPVTVSSMVNGTTVSVQKCPVCDKNLDSSKIPIIIVLLLFIGLLASSQ